jgi:hypothetical protein
MLAVTDCTCEPFREVPHHRGNPFSDIVPVNGSVNDARRDESPRRQAGCWVLTATGISPGRASGMGAGYRGSSRQADLPPAPARGWREPVAAGSGSLAHCLSAAAHGACRCRRTVPRTRRNGVPALPLRCRRLKERTRSTISHVASGRGWTPAGGPTLPAGRRKGSEVHAAKFNEATFPSSGRYGKQAKRTPASAVPMTLVTTPSGKRS